MGENTKIEWAHHTFNPWTGCTKVSAACDHCYAEGWSKRAGDKVGKWGPGAPRVRTSESNWRQPRRWNAEAERLGVRYRVFCASLADVFDNEVPVQWRADLLQLIDLTPALDWLLLTKRVGNVVPMLKDIRRSAGGAFAYDLWPRPNIWLGASITSQAEADRDLPKLLKVPAVKRFLSMEPLLGPVDLSQACAGFMQDFSAMGSSYFNWVIVGGESGPGARPMHPDWARSLRDQCAAAGVPFLFKQWGEWAGHKIAEDGEIVPGMSMDLRRIARWDGDIPREVLPQEPAGSVLAEGFVSAWVGKKAAGRLLDGCTWDGVPG